MINDSEVELIRRDGGSLKLMETSECIQMY